MTDRPLPNVNFPALRGGTGAALNLVAVVLALLLVSACSLPVDEEVRTLPAEDFEEIVQGGATTSTTTPPEGTPIALYFVVGQEGLGEVTRPLEDSGVDQILAALQQSPTEEEIAAYAGDGNLRTALPPELNPTPRQREPGSTLLQIDVADAGNLRELQNDAETTAVFVLSQIVCTVTRLNLETPIEQVEFWDSTGRLRIIDSDLSVIDGDRASRANYRDCETVRERRAAAAEAEAEETTTTEG